VLVKEPGIEQRAKLAMFFQKFSLFYEIIDLAIFPLIPEI